MQINIQGKNIELTQALKEYAEKKLQKFEHFFQNIQKVDIELEIDKIKEEARRQVAKVTVWANGTALHATEATQDMYSSIDLIIDKIDLQIKKFKDKMVHERRRDSAKTKAIINHAELSALTPEEGEAGTEK